MIFQLISGFQRYIFWNPGPKFLPRLWKLLLPSPEEIVENNFSGKTFVLLDFLRTLCKSFLDFFRKVSARILGTALHLSRGRFWENKSLFESLMFFSSFLSRPHNFFESRQHFANRLVEKRSWLSKRFFLSSFSIKCFQVPFNCCVAAVFIGFSAICFRQVCQNIVLFAKKKVFRRNIFVEKSLVFFSF